MPESKFSVTATGKGEGTFKRALNDRYFFFDTLFMSWHDTNLIQTFQKLNEDHLILRMSMPLREQNFKPVLIVDLFRK